MWKVTSSGKKETLPQVAANFIVVCVVAVVADDVRVRLVLLPGRSST